MYWLGFELVTPKYNSDVLSLEPACLVQLLPWILESLMVMQLKTFALQDTSDGNRMSCVHNAPQVAQITSIGANPFPHD
jgi:hypothetical protein